MQVVKTASSTRHSKLVSGSLENSYVGVASRVRPLGPASIVVSGAVVSTVMVRVAGPVGWLVARTSKVCGPSASAAVVWGDVQAVKASSSMRHSKLAPGSEENSNVGVGSRVNPLGPLSIVGRDTVVSTVKVRVAGLASVLPAASVARTSNVCGPSASAAVVWGEVQVVKASSSMRQSKLAPGSEENSNVGVASRVRPLGPVSIVVCGALVSTVIVRLAGVASVLPAASVARTSNVCVPSASAAVVCGELQALKAALSTRHSKLAPGSEENSNVGVASRGQAVGPGVDRGLRRASCRR